MKKFLFYKERDLLLINFDELLKEIEFNCLEELYSYGLIKDNHIDLSNRDTKKIIYHHIIHGLCEEITQNKHKYRKAIVVPPVIRDTHEIIRFCKSEDFESMLYKLLKTLQNSLPFVLYKSEYYIFEDEDMDPGKLQDILGILSQLCATQENKSFTFEKIKKFSNKFELSFLSQDYFNSVKTKLLLH